jgi:hypothetical protein
VIGESTIITSKEPNMSNAEMQLREPAAETLEGKIDMKLEVVVIPVSDADRAKRFYGDLGWRLDIDYRAGDDFRVIQFTPPGSGCSVIFGKNVTIGAVRRSLRRHEPMDLQSAQQNVASNIIDSRP